MTDETRASVTLICPRCGWSATGRFAQDEAEAAGELYPHLRRWHGLDVPAADAALARARRLQRA